LVEAKVEVKVKKVSIALRLLPVFTLLPAVKNLAPIGKPVSIALRLLPVFTHAYYLRK